MTAATRTRDGTIALALGPMAAIGAAGLLARFRDDVGAANAALVLAIVVMLGALAGRMAGLVTAIVAALSYNFFHTRPYDSLRIHAVRDVVTVALLALAGVVIGEVGASRRRSRLAARRRLGGERVFEEIAERLAAGAGPDEVWPLVHDGIVGALRVPDCRLVPGAEAPADVLPRHGQLVSTSMHLGPGGFLLPAGGAAIPVRYGRTTHGHVLLLPGPSGSSLEARQLAVALVDQLAVSYALSRS